MKGQEEYHQFLKEHPYIQVEDPEKYAQQLSELPRKTRKEILYLLDLGGFGELDHLVELVESCRNDKFSIKKIDETQIKLYCAREISAEELRQTIYQKDRERLTPNYREPPCKINQKAADRLKGNK